MFTKKGHPALRSVLSTIVATASLTAAGSHRCAAQTVVYDSTTGFQGTVNNGGASGTAGSTLYTHLLADDLTYTSGAGLAVSQFKFSISNANSVANTTVSEGITFYKNDGSGGGPGTVLGSFTMSPVNVAAGSVTLVTYAIPAGQQFILPSNGTPAGGTIWAAEYFTSSTASSTTLNNFGQGLYYPRVGTSQDEIFLGNSTLGPFNTSSPGGALEYSPYASQSEVADLGWQIAVVPESSDFGCAGGVLLLALVANRVWKSRSL